MGLARSLCRSDVDEILKNLLSATMQDCWIWHYDKRGQYTVKSGYKMGMMLRQVASSSSTCDPTWWRKLWKLKIPNKIKHFVWKSFHHAIPTMVNLGHHHVPVGYGCPICSERLETTDHALFHCTRAREIWANMYPNGCRIFFDHLDVKDRWVRLSLEYEEALSLICVGAWAIWND